MGQTLSYVRLMEYRKSLDKGLSTRRQDLNALKHSLSSLVSSQALQGQAADAINAYLNEVYLSGLIPALSTAITNLEQVLDMYVAGYTSVDGGSEFYLTTEEYSNLTSAIEKKKLKATEANQAFLSIASSIEDILDTSLPQAAKKSNQTGLKLSQGMLNTIKEQREDWSNYESQNNGMTQDVDGLLQQVKATVSSYMGQPSVRMNQYSRGQFGNSALGAELLAYSSALRKQAKANRKFDTQAKKLLNSQWKDHVKIVAADKARMRAHVKAMGWSKFWLETAGIVVGAVVTVATLGTAAPLVTAGVVAIGSVFAASRAGTDYEEATSGKRHEDFILMTSNYLFGKRLGGYVYQAADFATGLVGSGAAMKAIEKEGLKVAGIAEVKSSGFDLVKSAFKSKSLSEATSVVKGGLKDSFSVAKQNAMLFKTNRTSVGKQLQRLTEEAAQKQGASNVVSEVKKYTVRTYIKAGIKKAAKDTVSKQFINPIVDKEVPANTPTNVWINHFAKKIANKPQKITVDKFGKSIMEGATP